MTLRLPPALLALLASSAAAHAALELAPRSISSSKQFVVYSADANLRATTAMRAEQTKSEFLELVRASDEWKSPIIINLAAPPPNTKRPPRFQIGVYEGDDDKSKIQIDVFDLSLLKDPAFNTQLLAAIMLEFSYHRAPLQAGRSFQSPPSWAVAGIAEKIRAGEDESGHSTAGIYASLLSGAEPPKLKAFLDTQPERLDSTSRAIYQAQAAALLDALLSLPEGRAGLREYLSAPRGASASLGSILPFFPSLGKNDDALTRKWLLFIARASATNRVDPLSERDTAKELDALLAVKALPDPKHPEVASMSGPYALPAIARSQNGRFILRQLEDGLLRLSLRAHPLYKSLVDEYLGITRELAARPKRKVAKRIATAEELRAGLTRQTSESRDYLDWVEATKLKTENPELTEVIEEVDEIDAPPRNDAYARYLDAIEARNQ